MQISKVASRMHMSELNWPNSFGFHSRFFLLALRAFVFNGVRSCHIRCAVVFVSVNFRICLMMCLFCLTICTKHFWLTSLSAEKITQGNCSIQRNAGAFMRKYDKWRCVCKLCTSLANLLVDIIHPIHTIGKMEEKRITYGQRDQLCTNWGDKTWRHGIPSNFQPPDNCMRADRSNLHWNMATIQWLGNVFVQLQHHRATHRPNTNALMIGKWARLQLQQPTDEKENNTAQHSVSFWFVHFLTPLSNSIKSQLCWTNAHFQSLIGSECDCANCHHV